MARTIKAQDTHDKRQARKAERYRRDLRKTLRNAA